MTTQTPCEGRESPRRSRAEDGAPKPPEQTPRRAGGRAPAAPGAEWPARPDGRLGSASPCSLAGNPGPLPICPGTERGRHGEGRQAGRASRCRPGFPLWVDAGFGLRMCWLLSTGHLLRSQTPECRCPERARRGHVREKQPFTGRGRGDDPTGWHAEGAPRGGPPSFLPARLLYTVRGAGGRGVLSTPSQTLDSPARWLWGSPVPFGTK